VVVVRRAHAALLVAALAASLAACSNPNTIKVDAIFKDIGDLPRFANVQSSDVVIGSVRAVKLQGYTARVTLRIRTDAHIPRNAIALVRSTSLLGEEFVDLRAPTAEQPSADVLHDSDVIPVARTSKIPGLDDALISLGRLLEGGSAADLATVLHSSATIVKGQGAALGELLSQLHSVSGTLAARAPDISTTIGNLDGAISTLAHGSQTISSALSSSADATAILAKQRGDIDRLVSALGDASSVLARYQTATTPSTDRSIKDLTEVLDKVMTTTGNLNKALSSLAQFTDLWPRAFPGDYLQLDVALSLSNVPPPAGASAASSGPTVTTARVSSLGALLWGATR
jgi:phospholipid/cholesterol/gamma-HCH transport system substrate-binding protein